MLVITQIYAFIMIRVGYQKMWLEILVLNFKDGARHWKVSLSEVEQCV